MADNESETENTFLSEFLKSADLVLYEAKFKAFGISKLEHFQDIDSSDLKEIGLSNVEIKRFFRKNNELSSRQGEKPTGSGTFGEINTANPSASTPALRFGTVTFQRPSAEKNLWEQKKYGWIPYPTKERAKFMKECLPKYYKSFFAKCKNTREFVKLFHDEGRRMYDITRRITKIKSSIDSVLNTKDPGAAGKIYDDDYVLIPSDQIILRTNIQKLSELQENILKEEKNVKGHLNSLFATKSGKLIPGKQCSQSFDEESITALDEVKKKIENNLKDLHDKLSQCKDMFKGTLLLKNKSKKGPKSRTRERTKKERNREKMKTSKRSFK